MIQGKRSRCYAQILWLSMGLVSSAAWAATDDFEDQLVAETAEVPVSSIEQFVQMYGLVKDNYVDEKSDDTLFSQAMQGLLTGLDRYSRYLSAEDYQQLVQYTEGELASTDFELSYDSHLKQWMIAYLKADSDSAKQGLRNGVTVYKIDDVELQKADFNQDQVNHLLIGAIGSVLKLQLSANSAPLNIVRNKKIETETRGKLLANQVLLIKIKVFQQNTANEIKNIIVQYQDQKPKALLIDLRNNPGGLLSSAVEAVDLFLDQGVIVSTQSRAEGNYQFQALPSSEYKDLKLGILLNAQSASAAEVFSAALKEHKRAWLVGEKSYGKGVVQKLFPLADGSAVQMTVSHYFTPSGKTIEGIGVAPNMVYSLNKQMSEDSYIDNIAQLLLAR